MRASWNVVHHASTGSVVASAVSLLSKVAGGVGVTGLMSVPRTLQPVIATSTAPIAGCARRITAEPRCQAMCVGGIEDSSALIA